MLLGSFVVGIVSFNQHWLAAPWLRRAWRGFFLAFNRRTAEGRKGKGGSKKEARGVSRSNVGAVVSFLAGTHTPGLLSWLDDTYYPKSYEDTDYAGIKVHGLYL